MRRAIREHLRDFLAIAGVAVLATGIGVYILSNQRLRFPLVEDSPKRLEVELSNAQAVQPGQGQSVFVAGVEIGKIGGVELQDGLGVVELEIEREFDDVIREDATALLRPKTALKDMLIEVDPGEGEVLPEGGRIHVENTLPDVNPDEIWDALDSDARAYLKLLVSGAGKGLERRGNDLRETLRRFEPLHRDLARVTRAGARRRAALRRLVHNYSELIAELGRHPADLRRLVRASGAVFDALASEEDSISEAVARLPGSLRRTERTLAQVQEFAPVLRSALNALRPPIRELAPTNAAVRPFLRETTPIIRRQIRPFVRAARPWTSDLRLAARGTARATPDLTRSFRELNRFFNIGAYNPGGAEPLTGDDEADRRRQEGLLYWLAWTANNGVSLFSTADAQGPWRRLTLCNVPLPVVEALIGEVLGELAHEAPFLPIPPELVADPVNEIVNPILESGFGSCEF